MYGKLSAPIIMSDSFDESISTAYNYFTKHIFNKNKRLSLYGKNVYIEAHEMIDERPEGFWHIISLDEKHRFTHILPCINDPVIQHCCQNCIKKERTVALKYNTETRNICLYRACRIPWIVDIIALANKKDLDVSVWLKPGNNSSSDKLYLRYNHDGADFLVIFTSEKHFYRLISAYPVFFNYEKTKLEKEYSTYRFLP